MAWYSCYRNSPSERQPKSGCTSFLFARRQKNKGLTHVGLKCCSCMFKFFHENSYRVGWFIAIVILLPRRILSMLEIFSGGLACQTMKLKQLDWILVWRSSNSSLPKMKNDTRRQIFAHTQKCFQKSLYRFQTFQARIPLNPRVCVPPPPRSKPVIRNLPVWLCAMAWVYL